jgi:hypothetical protein
MIRYNVSEAKAMLRRTPEVLRTLLQDLPESWTSNNEGGETWSPFDVLGHLIHGEKTDWIERVRRCLAEGDDRRFRPFDRFAQFDESRGKSVADLLSEFRKVRDANLKLLDELDLGEDKLDSIGIHPKFGEVTLRQLLATWVAHDLDHITQICRVMAKQYYDEVGPWRNYMRVMQPLVDYETSQVTAAAAP